MKSKKVENPIIGIFVENMKKHKPELISPAGGWASLKAAVEAGADGVYFGVKGINMRHFADNFDVLEIKKVMSYLKEHGKKGYLALNTIIMNEELKKVDSILKKAKAAGVDAVILWDGAAFNLARKYRLRVHLSTQASVSNVEALSFYSKQGVKRTVLARECTLKDIKTIIKEKKKRKITCEIEAFIHGAMCVSISGRCFLSSYTFNKSANKGQCLQPCRREYTIKGREGEAEYIIGEDYVLSPRDLCTIDFIDELIEAGINAFKIEGRIRPPDYIKEVTACYREAIDAYYDGCLTLKLKGQLKERLGQVFNRGFSSGFYLGPPKEPQSIGLEHQYQKAYLGEVGKIYKKINVAEIIIRKESLKIGDDIIFIGKKTPALKTRIEEMQIQHAHVKTASKGEKVGVRLPFEVRPKDKVFLWRKKDEMLQRHQKGASEHL